MMASLISCGIPRSRSARFPIPARGRASEWDAFLEDLYQRWGGWANPGTKQPALEKAPRFEVPAVSGSQGQRTQPKIALLRPLSETRAFDIRPFGR